jgi:hypothetical protein
MYDDEKDQWESTIDLRDLTRESDLTIVDEERAPPLPSPREIQQHQEKLYQLRKDWTLFRAALWGGLVLGAVCIWIVLDKKHYPEYTQFATVTLSSLVTGIIGYLFGKSG